jgi:hypothetical protein
MEAVALVAHLLMVQAELVVHLLMEAVAPAVHPLTGPVVLVSL